MANVDRPTGFKPYSTLSGAPWNGAVRKFYTDTDCFRGDIMIQDAAGIASGGGAYQGVTRATSGTAGGIVGVVVGWETDPDNLGAKYHQGSATLGVYLCVDPDVIFIGQDNGAATLITAADVGLNYDFVVTAGTVATGVSNMEIDSGTAGATTLATPLQLIGHVDSPDNEVGVANAKLLVRINMHAYGNSAGSAGV